MMRAFYSTQKHIRLFIFGVPEGWQAAIYDLQKREWIDKGSWLHSTLGEAKTDLHDKAAALLGTKLLDLHWH
jgi:hypothetical protein